MASKNTVRFRLEGLEYALQGEKTPEPLYEPLNALQANNHMPKA